MNKLTVLGLVGTLLVGTATKSNESVIAKFNHTELTTILIHISINRKQIHFIAEC